MSEKMKKDLQGKLDHFVRTIRNNKRQALDVVRGNITRMGKIHFILDFVDKNNIELRVNMGEIKKLKQRIRNKDISPAAVGAGINARLATLTMKCEFDRGYNFLRGKLNKDYPGAVYPEKKRTNCEATNQYDKRRKKNTRDLDFLRF